ncbi:MAG: family efflux transporter subunit [Patescibacteria group bacterium]|nr:family efflux transporter subunit [Patescibacteria group bacterium]
MKSFIERAKTFWNNNKKSKLFWFIVVVVIIILFAIFHKGTKTADATVATATRANVVDSVVLSGRTKSASAVELGFADQGRVASVSVSEGQKVQQGQILASLDTSDLYANLKNAQAALTIARAGVATNTTSLDNVTAQQNTLVANAYSNLLSNGLAAASNDVNINPSIQAPVISGTYSGSEGEYDITVYSSNSNSGASWSTSGLESNVGQVSSNTPVPLGTKGLFISFPGTGYLYAGTKWVVNIPNKRSPNYTANYNAYSAALSARDLAISNAKADLSQNGTDNSIAQARVEQAQSQVDSILSQIGRRRIVASFDGTVANVNLKPGQTTTSIGSSDSSTTGTSGSTITLISQSDYEVVLDVPEISVAKLSVGQSVDIALDAYGAGVVFPGKITTIDPAETIVSGVPVYETKVAFTTPDERIRSGMTATATIVISSKENVLSIPASFIHSDTDRSSYVYVINKDDKTEKRTITTGIRGSDSSTEILSGLSEGDRVSTDALK